VWCDGAEIVVVPSPTRLLLVRTYVEGAVFRSDLFIIIIVRL